MNSLYVNNDNNYMKLYTFSLVWRITFGCVACPSPHFMHTSAKKREYVVLSCLINLTLENTHIFGDLK